MRGFEICSNFKHLNILIPKRQSRTSAGYDLAICEDITLKPGDIVLAKTGLKSFMMDDEVLKLYPRSSLAVKRGITLPNNVGIIDSDYYNNNKNEGHILIALYNFKDEIVNLKKGERVAQGIFVKYLTTKDDEPNNTIRTGGFGSTGVK